MNLKNITELPFAKTAEGLNLIVNDDGAAKQIPASEVGAQADWNEVNEKSPSFIKNKPVEEYDFDVEILVVDDNQGDASITVNSVDFNKMAQKFINKEPIRAKCSYAFAYSNDSYTRCGVYETRDIHAESSDGNIVDELLIGFYEGPYFVVLPDNSVFFE